MSDRRELARKYDLGAGTYSAQTYGDASVTARRQLALIRRWGTPIPSAGSVLELGCADGFVTEQLVTAGYKVTALDLSAGMVETAKRRLEATGRVADLVVCEVERYEPSQTFDVVAAMMRTFFHYVNDPVAVLARLAASTRTKILVDVNPRAFELDTALQMVREAGFRQATWRGFFVPQTAVLPSPAHRVLSMAERAPLLSRAVMRRGFHAVIKGEKAGTGH